MPANVALWKSVCALTLVVLCSCQEQMVRNQTSALTLGSSANSQRQVQSRRFDLTDEAGLMAAAVAVLQDLGYTIEETSVAAGMISATKDRSGSRVRASLVVRKSGDSKALVVRVTFQTIGVSGLETVTDAQIYRQFFDRLSQSIFLTGHEI